MHPVFSQLAVRAKEDVEFEIVDHITCFLGSYLQIMLGFGQVCPSANLLKKIVRFVSVFVCEVQEGENNQTQL